ncbi:MAG: hypothetical protein EPO32_08375 [Anaerolineae bacterium]|nr:MAG: hypothetical protein EPO32_08375 [Anaerolineae bacterium]
MSRSASRQTSKRPHSRRRKNASTPVGGGVFPGLALIPVIAAALACLFTYMLNGDTSSPLTLRQELAARAARAAGAEEEDEILPATAAAEESELSPVFTPEVQYWANRILEWSAEFGLDPNLAATVMQIESCGDPRALSRAGAMGLFQVMPYHFSRSDDPWTPATNALRGLNYLQQSLETHGTARLALAGYNGGIGRAGQPESYWPAETVRYAYWGSGIYLEASNGKTHSERLDEWLAAGGASLCAQAAERLGLKP